jgi:hypothetical protein
LKNRAPSHRAVFQEDLRHAQLDSDNPVDGHLFSLLQRALGYWLPFTTSVFRSKFTVVSFQFSVREAEESK